MFSVILMTMTLTLCVILTGTNNVILVVVKRTGQLAGNYLLSAYEVCQ